MLLFVEISLILSESFNPIPEPIFMLHLLQAEYQGDSIYPSSVFRPVEFCFYSLIFLTLTSRN